MPVKNSSLSELQTGPGRSGSGRTVMGSGSPVKDAGSRYRQAIGLYRDTDMPVREICARTGVPVSGFRAYIRRRHRDMMFARHGIGISPEEAAVTRLRGRSGESSASRARYGDAVRACGDISNVGFSVSHIARESGLSPSALSNHLRRHYPGILEFRERERLRRGVNDNLHRGAKPRSREQYAGAVEHLRATDDSVRQTAGMYGLSYSGLREYLLHEHKDLTLQRAERRRRAESDRTPGGLSGNGRRRGPAPGTVEKYRDAVMLYRNTSMTLEEISGRTGVTVSGLRHYMRSRPDAAEAHRRLTVLEK